jgi:hypothetical protein
VGRLVGRFTRPVTGGVHRGRVTVASGGHTIASAIGSRFASFR